MAARKNKIPQFKKVQPHGSIEFIYRKKEFGKAPVEKHFILQDGRKIESLFQLANELENMTEENFKKHVTEFKNDFANWARDVFAATPLADELQFLHDRAETQRAIMKHLLRELAQIMSKEHREEVKQEIQQKTKAIKCVIK